MKKLILITTFVTAISTAIVPIGFTLGNITAYAYTSGSSDDDDDEEDYSIDGATWDTSDGRAVATWEKSESYQDYTVSLYFEDKKVSGTATLTSGGSLDMTDFIISKNKAGSYTFKVTGSKKVDGEKPSAESDTLDVTDDMLEDFKSGSSSLSSRNSSKTGPGVGLSKKSNKNSTDSTLVSSVYNTESGATTSATNNSTSNTTSTGSSNSASDVGTWMQYAGYWFYYQNGDFVKENIVVSKGVVYYMDQAGRMITNAYTPNHMFYADVNGALSQA
jgi:hypothetical protein